MNPGSTAPSRTRPSHRQGAREQRAPAAPVSVGAQHAAPLRIPPLAVFTGAPFRRGIGWALGLAALAIGLLAAGMVRADTGLRTFGPAVADQWGLPWFIAAILVSAFTALTTVQQALISQYEFHVFPAGLVIKRPLRQPLRISWETIRGICASVAELRFFTHTFGWRRRATLVLQHGGEIQLKDSYCNGKLPELITHIKAHVYPRLLPELRAGFRDGKWFRFGPLAVQKGFIQLARAKPLPWKQVRALTIENGRVVVELKKSAAIRLPVGRIPNPELLIQILREEAGL